MIKTHSIVASNVQYIYNHIPLQNRSFKRQSWYDTARAESIQ